MIFAVSANSDAVSSFKTVNRTSTDALGVINASGVISLGTVPPLLPEFDRKSEGAGSEGIFLRSVWEPVPDSLSELWSVRLSEKPVGEGTKREDADLLIYSPDHLFHHLQLLRVEVKTHSKIPTPGGQPEEVS